jgi:hypothetical protein
MLAWGGAAPVARASRIGRSSVQTGTREVGEGTEQTACDHLLGQVGRVLADRGDSARSGEGRARRDRQQHRLVVAYTPAPAGVGERSEAARQAVLAVETERHMSNTTLLTANTG